MYLQGAAKAVVRQATSAVVALLLSAGIAAAGPVGSFVLPINDAVSLTFDLTISRSPVLGEAGGKSVDAVIGDSLYVNGTFTNLATSTAAITFGGFFFVEPGVIYISGLGGPSVTTGSGLGIPTGAVGATYLGIPHVDLERKTIQPGESVSARFFWIDTTNAFLTGEFTVEILPNLASVGTDGVRSGIGHFPQHISDTHVSFNLAAASVVPSPTSFLLLFSGLAMLVASRLFRSRESGV